MNFLVTQTLYPGDLVLTVPLLQHLRAAYPDSGVSVLVRKGLEGLLESHPSVTSVLTFDRRKRFRRIVAQGGALRDLRFSHAIVLPGSVRTALAVFLARVPCRIGSNMSSGVFLFSDRVRYPGEVRKTREGWWIAQLEGMWRMMGGRESFVTPLYTEVVALDPGRSAIRRHLQLLEPLGIGIREDLMRPRLFPSNGDIQTVNELLAGVSQRTLVAIAPGSRWATKRWPIHSFVMLAAALAGMGFCPVFVGGEDDRGLATTIDTALASGSSLNVIGRLSLLQTAELLRRCEVLVANDSAPLHLAAAMETRTLTILGPTVTGFGFVPTGERHGIVELVQRLPCRPCTPFGGERCPIGTHECMGRIGVEAVLEKALLLLDRSPEHQGAP